MTDQPQPPPLPPSPPPLPRQVQPLNYQGGYGYPPPSTAATVKWLLLGLGIGTVISVGLWIPLWMFDKQGNIVLTLGLTVIGIKFVCGVVGLCIPGWRAFGGGILLSIVLGFLVFFGACAVNM